MNNKLSSYLISQVKGLQIKITTEREKIYNVFYRGENFTLFKLFQIYICKNYLL